MDEIGELIKANIVKSQQNYFICLECRLSSITYSQILGAVSLKLIGGKFAPKLAYFELKKEPLNLSELAPYSNVRYSYFQANYKVSWEFVNVRKGPNHAQKLDFVSVFLLS